MDILQGLSDDQTALIGCFAALIVSGTLMSLSFYVGRFFNKQHQAPEPNEPHTLRMPDPLTARAAKTAEIKVAQVNTPQTTRRAA